MSAHPAPARSHVALSALWFGLFGGPAAWSIQTLVNLPVASHGCFPRLEPLSLPIVGGLRGIAFAVSVLALIVCAAALATSARSWSQTRHEHQRATGSASEHDPSQALAETGEGRTRFMALSGVLLSLTFLLMSLVHTAALFLVRPCGM
jgi:hypothetical protein